ncbi:uncharacterized protein LOC116259065 [Nymphaea colorata]|nr:uncharacterized protein LOC116259065 [Nymphaea colorata]XP_031492535.1 uncharacterized protein LOC116259065 [Nymphaea colorata]XP_049934909.1 uncharacterized protein LOC116259065 [Nymphaea colorata]XP_049934910.1 uncharacterized protein LOC116259065 [Nymphaea colorata]
MRGQQPGVSQPRLGFTDMQLLQQQYFSKQFQELQRQHQLQQLDQGARPQNLQSQFSALTAQTAGDQLTPVVDGTPIRDASNYIWSSERVPQVGVDPKMLNSSQMFILGNPGMARTGAPAIQGFPNGLGLQQENTHTLRSMGFIPQQLDQSMYGTSFGGIRESSSNLTNPYSSVQWSAHGNADLLTKASGNQDQKTVIQSNAFGSFHGDQSAPVSGLVSGNDGIPASKHSYHGKNIFGRPQGMHSVNSGIHPGNFQQVSSSPRNSQIQEFHGRVEHTGWSGNVEEKVTPQVGPPQGVTSLHPLEEKILYGGDDNAWNGIQSGQPLPSAFGGGGPNSMNTGGFIQSNNQVDGSDYLNMFPSIQSGSWSALMQSAVAEASSSDTGMQDEWSGLSYQKAELSTGNPSELNESGRQSTGWNEANAETPSSLPSRSFHLFDDTTVSTGGQSRPEYQQITPKPTYSQSGKLKGSIPCSQDFIHNDGPSDSLGKSSNEARWLEQIPQESSVADVSVRTPLALGSASDSAWRTDAYNQSNKGAPENISSDSLNIRSSWPHQQKPIFTRETDEQHVSKLNAWNMNESLPDRDNMQDDENNLQECQKSESKGTIDIGTGRNFKLWEVGQLDGVQKNDVRGLSSFSNLNERFGQAKSSSNGPLVHNAADACINSFIPTPGPGMSNLHQERIQQVQNNHQFAQSLSSKKEGENQSQHQQALNSSLNHSDNALGETHESSRVMCYPTMGHGDGLTPDYIYHGQHATVSSALKENTWSAKKDSHSSAAEMQRLPMPVVGRSGLSSPHGFLYHPTGELPVNFQQSSSMKRDLLYQGLQHAASGEQKSLDLGYMSHTKPVNNAVNSEKDFMDRNLQNSRTGPGDAPASFDGPMAMYHPSSDKYKTSQNMLELLNKVDQCTENAPKPFGSEEHGPSSAMSEAGKSNTATVYLQGNQLSSSQGFGLHLAPPSSAPAASKHFLTSDVSLQVSTDLNSRHADMGNLDKGKIWLRNQISPQVLQHASDTSQQEYWAHKSGSTVMEQEFSPITNRDINSKLKAKHNVVAASGIHYLRNQLHRQDSSSVSGQAVVEESATLVTAKQADQSKQDRSDSGFSQSEGLQGGCTGELSRRVFQPETTGKVVPFDLNPHAGTDFTGSSASSLLVRDSNGMNRQLPSSASSPYTGNLRQLVHTSEQVPVSQVSGQQGMAQHRSFPTMLQNAWSNMSAQRSMSGLAQKVSTNPLPSFSPATTWVFQTVNDQNLSGRGGCTSEAGPSSSSKHQLPSNEPQQNRDGTPHQIPYDRAVPYGSGSSMETLEHNRRLAGFPLHNQNIVGDREAPESSLASKSTNISFQSTSDSAARSQPNYSLLRQMQTMKSLENDPTKAIKKHKGEDDADVSHMTGKMGEKPLYSYGNSGNALASVSQSIRGMEQSHRNYQMATSWFEQFGNYKNGQFLTMSDRFAVPQNSAKPLVQQYFFGRVSESRHPHTVIEQKNINDANQVGSTGSIQITTSLMPSKDHMFPFSTRPDTNDQSQAIVRHKKRKLATLELLPWDNVITRTSRKIQSTSSVELRWAHATERRVEKIDDEVEFIDDGLLMPGPRRRIIFTTQLMQQIICPLRAAMLSAEADKEYEAVTYILAKLLLGDACSLISSLAADSQAHTDQDSSTSKKPGIFRRLGNQFISKLMEGFLEKSRKLENDFLRLEKGPSLLDIRVECQDLERFSIINRFAKFHGRGPAEGAAAVEGAVPASAAVPSSVSSSSSDAVGVVPRKLFPHRYVTAVPMPRNLPEGMQCHSL